MIAPEDGSVVAGNTVLFTCVGYGEGSTSVSWKKGDASLVNDSRTTITNDLITEGGVAFVQSVLEICSTEVADTGQYSCTADNGVGIDTTMFALTVTQAGGGLA